MPGRLGRARGAGRPGWKARASAEFLSACSGSVEVHGFRDGFLPYSGGEVKELFENLKTRVDPQLVLTHRGTISTRTTGSPVS